MMYKIEVADVYDGYLLPGDDVPRIVAVGETEMEAVDIYAILYNAHLITAPGKELTNVGDGLIHTTYISGFENFASLKRYFEEVNGTVLQMTQY